MNAQQQSPSSKTLRFLPLAALLILAGAVFFIAMDYYITRKDAESITKQPMAEEQKKRNGLVYGEEQTGSIIFKYNSENYKVPQIGTGGVVLNYFSDEDQWPLEIGEVDNEVFSEKNKNYKKLNITWETAKPAKCELRYRKAGSAEDKVFEEQNYSINHSVMLASLDSASTYNYKIVARDRWQNEKDSDDFAVYTGAPELSILDLLAGAFKEIFGWAMK